MMMLREQENVQTRDDKICTTESQRELGKRDERKKMGGKMKIYQLVRDCAKSEGEKSNDEFQKANSNMK